MTAPLLFHLTWVHPEGGEDHTPIIATDLQDALRWLDVLVPAHGRVIHEFHVPAL